MKQIKIEYYSMVEGNYSVIADIEDEKAEEINEVITEYEQEKENYERRDRYHGTLSMDEVVVEPVASDDSVKYLLEKEAMERIFHAIEELPEVQQRRLKMMLSGMKYNQIAAREGVSIAAVGESVKTARIKLLKILKES